MTLSYRLIEREETEAHRDEVLAVHRRAFSQGPNRMSEEDMVEFDGYFLNLADLTGFRCMAAFDKGSDGISGFALGWTSVSGMPWRDTIEEALGSKVSQEWLTDCFEFALIATDPKRQGEGIGGRLHDELLSQVTHRRAILSTLQEETPALRLFRSRGWQTLLSDFSFEEDGDPFLIMGCEKWAAA